MYWQYPVTSSPQWNLSVSSPLTSCDERYVASAQFVPMPISNGKYGFLSNDFFPEFYEDDAQVKRPMNSFLLWAKIMRKKFAKDYPNLHNAEISKLLGKVWNGMTTSEKRPFVEKAEKLRVLHMRDHPNYRYAPKKKREKRAAQRMIPPEVAAAFHNAIFDLKGVNGSGARVLQGRMQEETNEELPESLIFGRNFQPAGVSLALPLTASKSQEDKDHTTAYENSFSNLMKMEHSCDIKQEQSTQNLVLLSRASENSHGQITPGAVKRPKSGHRQESCFYQDHEMKHTLGSETGMPRNFVQDNSDQVTPSSPQDNVDSFGYPTFNEENFYPTVETSTDIFCGKRAKLVHSTSTLSGDSDSLLPRSPQTCYDDEVPPFLRVLLDKPIHLEVSKNDPYPSKEEELIFHDLGEIISKELGIERKACLYS